MLDLMLGAPRAVGKRRSGTRCTAEAQRSRWDAAGT